MEDSPDPRVVGPKIVFDSRFDRYQTTGEKSTEAYPPYTLDDKK